jgi:hypothetical protein
VHQERLGRGTKAVDVVHLDVIRLQQEVLYLRARIRKLIALRRVVLVVLKLSGYSLNHARVPDEMGRKVQNQVGDAVAYLGKLRGNIRGKLT